MIFLAQFVLRTSYYMNEDDTVLPIIRLVEADSKKEAEIKLHKEYNVNYYDFDDQTKSFEFKYNYSERNSFDTYIITPMIV